MTNACSRSVRESAVGGGILAFEKQMRRLQDVDFCKSEVAGCQCCCCYCSFGEIFHKEFPLGSWDPRATKGLPFWPQTGSAGSTDRTLFLDLSGVFPFCSIFGNWLQDHINSSESPRTKHAVAFISENVYCVPMAWRALSWILNVNCGLDSPCTELEFPLRWGVLARTHRCRRPAT